VSQSDFGTIVASTKTGAALATDLNNWRDALHTGHRGSTAPPYAVAGIVWLDDSGGVTDVLVKRYDGTDWITEGAINETVNTYTPYLAGATIGSMSLASSNVLDRTGASTAAAADRGKLIDCSSGTWTLTLTAPGTLGDGWYCGVRNSGSGVITVTPTSGNINGASTLPLSAGASCLIFCNGTGFFTVGLSSDTIVEDTDTGDGSTVAFTLSATPAGTTDQDIHVDAGGMFINTTYYSVSGTTLTFTDAPPNGVSLTFRYRT
jgi:hypothetical protein